MILGPLPSYPLKCNEKDKEALNLPTNLSTVEFDRIRIILNDTAFTEIHLTLFTNTVLFKYKKFIHCHRHCHYHSRYPIPLSFKILLSIEVIHEIALSDSRFRPFHFLPPYACCNGSSPISLRLAPEHISHAARTYASVIANTTRSEGISYTAI